MSDEAIEQKPEPKLPPTHDSHATNQRVLEENQVDHAQLQSKLSGKVQSVGSEFKQTVIKTDRANVIEVLRTLHDDPELGFDMLTDITAVDNMRRPDFDPENRYTLIHIVYSLTHKKRVRVETQVPESDPTAPTASVVYKGAAWVEREVYDMFGIEFAGHPKMERVLCPDYYEYHALRKDYPLTGRGERDNFVRAEEVN